MLPARVVNSVFAFVWSVTICVAKSLTAALEPFSWASFDASTSVMPPIAAFSMNVRSPDATLPPVALVIGSAAMATFAISADSPSAAPTTARFFHMSLSNCFIASP